MCFFFDNLVVVNVADCVQVLLVCESMHMRNKQPMTRDWDEAKWRKHSYETAPFIDVKVYARTIPT